jgi:tetratricopeptide (TPR) repeat protein
MQNYKIINRVCAGFAFLFSFIVYLKTIAPTVSFWDCGEFITCSYILGIPHPPGAPFFLLLGRLFTMVPFAADIGFRVNLISVISTGLTIMLTFLIIVRLIKQWRGEPKNWEDVVILCASGLIGALGFAFTDTLWFNAVESEVYAISMFLTTAVVWLILVWLEKADQQGNERYLLLIAYLLGLAIGVHLLMILAIPAIGMIVYFKYLDQTNEKINLKNLLIFAVISVLIFMAIYPGIVKYVPALGELGFWAFIVLLASIIIGIYYANASNKRILTLVLMALMLVLVGYSTYAMIYIRSGLDPAIDENDPENMPQMMAYLNREQYGTWSTFPRRYPGLPTEWEFEAQYPGRGYASFNFGKQMNFMWNYQIKKMYLRYFGWQFIGKGTTLDVDSFIAENFSLNSLLGLPFLLGLIGMVHHFYRHWRHALSITALFILTGVAIVIYLNQEDPQPRERDYVYVGSFFAFAIWMGMGVSAILEWIQESAKSGVLRKVLFAITVVLFTFMAPINLLAHNYHEHDRTGNYVAYDYSYNILQSCEPNSILFTNGDNDTFPLWFLQYVYGIRTDVRVVNLSLLNTPWYIKQLKHEEPRVPISLSDEEIDNLAIRGWKKQAIRIPVSRGEYERYVSDLGEHVEFLDQNVPSFITVEVEPTIAGRGIRIQDWMILNIIFSNQWRNPINFAVTVSTQNQLNLEKYLRMDGLSFKLVPYEGTHLALDKLEENLTKVFQYRGLNDPDVYLNTNIKGLLQNYRAAYLNLAKEYLIQKNYDKMTNILDSMERAMPMELIPMYHYRLLLQIGQWYSMASHPDKAIEYAEQAYKMEPDSPYVYGTYISILSDNGQHDRAVEMLEEWLAKNPDDQQARQRLEEEKKLLQQSVSGDSVTSTHK